MDPGVPDESKGYRKGTAGALIALLVVVGVAIAFPAYRWFILISVGIGALVALILYVWHRFRPIKEENIENKRPLGLG